MKGLLINAIAVAVEKVTAVIEERAAEKAARTEMHDFCEKHGYHVTPVMDAHAIAFMEIVNRYKIEGLTVQIKYKTFQVAIDRDGNRTRTDWVATNKTAALAVITVHSGEVKF